jgi:hypothetical protein
MTLSTTLTPDRMYTLLLIPQQKTSFHLCRRVQQTAPSRPYFVRSTSIHLPSQQIFPSRMATNIEQLLIGTYANLQVHIVRLLPITPNVPHLWV